MWIFKGSHRLMTGRYRWFAAGLGNLGYYSKIDLMMSLSMCRVASSSPPHVRLTSTPRYARFGKMVVSTEYELRITEEHSRQPSGTTMSQEQDKGTEVPEFQTFKKIRVGVAMIEMVVILRLPRTQSAHECHKRTMWCTSRSVGSAPSPFFAPVRCRPLLTQTHILQTPGSGMDIATLPPILPHRKHGMVQQASTRAGLHKQ